jgi:hypothetical protein
MAGLAVRETVTLAGRAERARVARAFVFGVLGPGHPCGDVAVLLVSEMFGNSVRFSGSGVPGETVTVAVRAGDGVVRVEVTDRSGPGAPELYPAGRDAEGGRAARSHQALRHHPGRADLPDRAGHGVAVLLKIYAHCIDGQADAANCIVSCNALTPT